jgi:tetratricopeptide (TPR) repeat protein
VDISISRNRLSSRTTALVLIALSVLAVYSNAYDCPFVFDDERSIVERETIRDPRNYTSLAELLKPRAIVDLTFALNYSLGRLEPFGYHLVNILIHILNGLLAYWLALAVLGQLSEAEPSHRPKKTKKKIRKNRASDDGCPSIEMASLFAALIFVLHPVQTQAVTYIVQRYASVSTLFYLSSLLFYMRARISARGASRDPRTAGIYSSYFLSILFAVAAFLSKQNAASLPAAILLVEWMLFDRTWQGWKKKLPWIALFSLLWALLVLFVAGLFSGGVEGAGLLEDVSGLAKETERIGRWQYLCTQFNVLVIYIRLLFLPVQQNLDYVYPFKEGFLDGFTPLAFLFLAGVAALGIRNLERRPAISFGIFYFFITLSVESSIIPIRDALFEHRLYLPMFGFALLVSHFVLHLLSGRQPWMLFSAAAILLALGAATYARNSVWRDGTALWSDVVSKSPHNHRAHNNLANALAEKGRLEEAIEQYETALRIHPDYDKAHNNLANALEEQGQTDRAIRHYREALRLNPDYAKAHANLANALIGRGRNDEAIEHYREALGVRPGNAQAHSDLGVALGRRGRIDEAIEQYREALHLRPDFPEAHYNLANALRRRGRTDEAILHYRKALDLKTGFVEAHFNLGIALSERGREDEAVEHFEEVLRIIPGHAQAERRLEGARAAR